MNHQLAAAETAIYNAISNHPVMAEINGIYSGMAPEDAVQPYVLVQLATAQDYNCESSGDVQLTAFQYLVEVCAAGESFPHEIAAKVNEALQGCRETITIGGESHSVNIHRLRPVALAEQYNGREIRRSGAIYRVSVN